MSRPRGCAAVIFGIFYLPVDPWVRAFLAVGTLARRRLDKILAEHDPFLQP